MNPIREQTRNLITSPRAQRAQEKQKAAQ